MASEESQVPFLPEASVSSRPWSHGGLALRLPQPGSQDLPSGVEEEEEPLETPRKY